MNEDVPFFDETTRFIRAVADRKGWALNPDESFVGMLVEGLAANRHRYGYYHCPCRDSDENRDLDRDKICPCVWAEDDIREYAQCYCGLYLDRSKKEAGFTPQAIPDRRYPPRPDTP